MKNTRYILMWLEAPLQAWGFDSKFSRRDTLSFPTKSGILGLICCALGAGGEQRELLGLMSPLKITVISFENNRYKGSPVKLQDFHMVGAGYEPSDKFQRLMLPKKSDGTLAANGTKLTYRYYLQGAVFAIVLEAPEQVVEKFADALTNPVWDLYLGRKNCVPTDFIYRGIYENEDEAINHATEIADEKTLKEKFRVVDGIHDNGEVILLNDVPIQFGENKEYSQRYVTVMESDDTE